MAKRIGPEAKIIALFNALPEDSQRIVLDVIKSQSPRKVKDPKSPAPSVARRSSQKQEKATHTQNIEGDKENALDASKVREVCVICGNEESYDGHRAGSPNFHIFRTEIKKKKNGGITLPDVPEDFNVKEATA